MPNRDGTGPRGDGSMTGAKRGRCSGSKSSSVQSGKKGQGLGRFGGRGRRYRNQGNVSVNND